MATIKELIVEIKKVDIRYIGYPYFKHCVSIHPTYDPFKSRKADNLFFEIREWCWQTWGASKEVDEWVADKQYVTYQIVINQTIGPLYSQNDNWSWKKDKSTHRIYLAKDEDLTMFKLRWE
jgi:hypothetical protein